jgi:hypothetical protein
MKQPKVIFGINQDEGSYFVDLVPDMEFTAEDCETCLSVAKTPKTAVSRAIMKLEKLIRKLREVQEKGSYDAVRRY